MTNFFFGPQQAQQLIDTMRVIHGNLFTHQMGNVSPDQVETIIIGAMVGDRADKGGQQVAKLFKKEQVEDTGADHHENLSSAKTPPGLDRG